MKKVLVLITFLIASCGYQPLYVNIDTGKSEFQKITLLGEKNINRNIISTISLKENPKELSLNEIILTSKKEILETSKDSKGRVISYKMLIEIKAEIKKGDKIVKGRTFSKDFSYNNKENKFDLTQYEEEIEKNLIFEIITELIIFIKNK
tara:strand:+ start:169 stop:618 length:450 start_codon:yes stop_codon:yes gene_type:complete